MKSLRALFAPARQDEKLKAEYAGADAENISYDYFKSLTSLSLLTLGGVLTLSESVFAERIDLTQMMIASLLVAAAGIVSLQCQSDIVQVSRGAKSAAPWLRFGHRLAPGLLGAGIGTFLMILGGVAG